MRQQFSDSDGLLLCDARLCFTTAKICLVQFEACVCMGVRLCRTLVSRLLSLRNLFCAIFTLHTLLWHWALALPNSADGTDAHAETGPLLGYFTLHSALFLKHYGAAAHLAFEFTAKIRNQNINKITSTTSLRQQHSWHRNS